MSSLKYKVLFFILNLAESIVKSQQLFCLISHISNGNDQFANKFYSNVCRTAWININLFAIVIMTTHMCAKIVMFLLLTDAKTREQTWPATNSVCALNNTQSSFVRDSSELKIDFIWIQTNFSCVRNLLPNLDGE